MLHMVSYEFWQTFHLHEWIFLILWWYGELINFYIDSDYVRLQTEAEDHGYCYCRFAAADLLTMKILQSDASAFTAVWGGLHFPVCLF